MTSKQRSYLKSLAVGLDTIFQIGKGDVTDEICARLSDAIEARELIKIKVLPVCPKSVKEVAGIISSAIGAEIVQTIGSKAVFYRISSNEKNRKIDLSNIK